MRSEASLKWVLPLVLIGSFGSPGARGTWAGDVIERTLAFVNRKPVLLSDVELTRALLQLDEKEATERTIDETLMFEEASRLLTQIPSGEAVDLAVSALREKAGARFGVAALRRKALAQLAIADYINQRLRPLVRVDDAEVRKLFNERVLSDPQPPSFNLVTPALREGLERRSLDQKVEEWVTALRLRAEIRRPPLSR